MVDYRVEGLDYRHYGRLIHYLKELEFDRQVTIEFPMPPKGHIPNVEMISANLAREVGAGLETRCDDVLARPPVLRITKISPPLFLGDFTD